MTAPRCLAIVLAAGEGTRMASTLPKVLHPVGGRPMVDAVVAAAAAGGADAVAVVVGAGGETVAAHLARSAPAAAIHVQAERRGTAHAALAARAALDPAPGTVLVLFGDTPLVRPQTVAALIAAVEAGADLAVAGFEAADPTGYGRVILDGEGRPVRIVEERDADAATRALRLCNGGIMGFSGRLLPDLLDGVGTDNAKGEYYLTDAVALAARRGLRTALLAIEETEVLGVNDRAQLAAAEAVFQARARAAALAGGASLVAPETVFFSHDTRIGRDVTVEPNVIFGPGVTVADGALVRGFCHIEQSSIGPGAVVGPFARLRPGAAIGPDAHIGNFCEVKNSTIGRGTKINHLTYIGDSDVGERTNVGAGTITCNYDGVLKHRTTIGSGTFIGSHTTLVAPVSVGDGAYTAAGSVVTEPVPDDATAFARARQTTKPGHARALRERLAAEKARR
jgi:bifunctional UDP-N-acetylglucosamine pyrophosphorylase/glucosamine-1-phosphate N-acetyltransferase